MCVIPVSQFTPTPPAKLCSEVSRIQRRQRVNKEKNEDAWKGHIVLENQCSEGHNRVLCCHHHIKLHQLEGGVGRGVT